MADQVNPLLLNMPLAELRERVELAERLAIANRFASTALSGPAASAASPTGAGKEAPAAAPVKPAAPAAKPAAAKPAAKPVAPATPPVEEDLEAAFGDGTGGDADDFSDGGDMLEGFVEELTPDQAKAAALEIAKAVIAKKDKGELTTARSIMSKYGVTKVSDIPDDKAVEAYEDFKAGFPDHVS